jgi:lipoprotein signal peptidase
MSSPFRHTLIILGGGILLFVDRFFKWQAFHGWNEPHLISRFLGWYPFLNRGIAFSIPLPMFVTVY